MTYNFDKPTVRLGTDCIKWDETGNPNILPMWVADMDFETAPCVAEAVRRRAALPIYGYGLVPERFYDAIRWWNRTRYGWDIERKWILYTSGVIAAFSAAVQALCRGGNPVLTLLPAYNCFFSTIRNARCPLVGFPLTWDATGETHTIDFEALEHVWTEQELHTIADICRRNDVIVVSDEIHSDFIHPQLGRRFVPFGPIAEEAGCQWVVTSAPNKAFNIAGLQTAYIVTPSEKFRQLIDRALNDNETCDINVFASVALQAAYTPEGAEWLDQLIAYIFTGSLLFRQQMKSSLSQLPLARLEGTYLAWLDVTGVGRPSEEMASWSLRWMS